LQNLLQKSLNLIFSVVDLCSSIVAFELSQQSILIGKLASRLRLGGRVAENGKKANTFSDAATSVK
jgi:hypothetical protein